MPHDIISAKDLAEERWLEFSRTFGGSEFFEDDFIAIVEHLVSVSSALFGDENANECFDLLVQRAFSRDEGSWRAILDNEYHGIYSETTLGTLIHDLSAYADFGIIVTPSRSPEHRVSLLESQVQKAIHILPMVQQAIRNGGTGPLAKILRKAIARWKVDTGTHVDADELALLSGRALQTIRNNLGPRGKRITGNLRRIEASDALDWLATQRNFRSSIWREQDDTEIVAEMDRGLGEVAFVPVAADGSTFHPGLKRDGSYLIHADGTETAIDNYDEALRSLQIALHPQWRRPTAGGSWVRVRGVDWRRIPVDELIKIVD